jgi:hypothetical protein
MLELKAYESLSKNVKNEIEDNLEFMFEKYESVESLIEQGEIRLFNRSQLIEFLFFDDSNSDKKTLLELLSTTDTQFQGYNDGLDYIVHNNYDNVFELSNGMYLFVWH